MEVVRFVSDDCLFCGIARGDNEASVVHEDEEVIAFEDINPQAPEHLLIVPKRHIASVNELSAEDETLVGHLYTVARTIAESKNFSEEGYRLIVNCGDDARQSVDHLHLHCLAGREMDWPPG